MTDLTQTYHKGENDNLTHDEWNDLMGDLNAAAKFIHTTEKGNFEIESKNKTTAELIQVEYDESLDDSIPFEYDYYTHVEETPEATIQNANFNKVYVTPNLDCYKIVASESPNIKLETDSAVNIAANSSCVWDDVNITSENFSEYRSQMATGLKKDTDPETKYVDGYIYGITTDDRGKKDISMSQYDENLRYVRCRQLNGSGGVNIESDTKVKISSPKTTLEGVTGFGSTMSFGETDEGIKFQYKATKKGKIKQCDVLLVEVFNNTDQDVTFSPAEDIPSNNQLFPKTSTSVDPITAYCDDSIQVGPKQKAIIGQCSVYDIIKFITWAKDNSFGPWDPLYSNQNL